MAVLKPPSRHDDPAQQMKGRYRWIRHVYDSTRRYYLPGRDRMLEQIADRPAGTVLEVGCGTARNLRVLDETAPQHTLYGLAPSLATLATARDKLDRAGCTERITLAKGLAHELDPKEQFGVDGPFDVIFVSHVLSMISSWPQALDAALEHLSPNGRLYIVDFWDQDNRTSSVATLLQRWLFDVEPRPAPINTLRQLEAERRLSCTITPVAQRSAYLATIQRETDDRSETADPSSPHSVAETKVQRFDGKEVIPAYRSVEKEATSSSTRG